MMLDIMLDIMLILIAIVKVILWLSIYRLDKRISALEEMEEK